MVHHEYRIKTGEISFRFCFKQFYDTSNEIGTGKQYIYQFDN